jgi:hypothetical protein
MERNTSNGIRVDFIFFVLKKLMPRALSNKGYFEKK